MIIFIINNCMFHIEIHQINYGAAVLHSRIKESDILIKFQCIADRSQASKYCSYMIWEDSIA